MTINAELQNEVDQLCSEFPEPQRSHSFSYQTLLGCAINNYNIKNSSTQTPGIYELSVDSKGISSEVANDKINIGCSY